MRDLSENPRTERTRRSFRSRDNGPQQSGRSAGFAHAQNSEVSAKMALTCKVQYVDDTDPFASTNFPEPTRPPTYTFHLNIPLCQQLAGLHRLLSAPHAVCEAQIIVSQHLCTVSVFCAKFSGLVLIVESVPAD